jgi:L-seryl-tRNA(Ser) seleniumtransferase
VAEEVSEALEGSLREVINASGVILHTNLGRAPLSREAAEAVQRVSGLYNNLEYDLESGERGSRMSHVSDIVARLSGAEAALVVNNNAAAVFMALSAFARDREVILSRGQAVEIGGSFRIPDVMTQSGAKLVEVGTTNKTYIRDYEAAITPQTAMLMRVHSSNFKVIGFTHSASLEEMAQLAEERGLILVDDLGSGTFMDTARYGLAHEPTVPESIRAGAHLVTFSGDKLLGGPQAGLIAGKKALIDRLKKHPLARALRVDKMTIAALQVTLQHYLKDEAERKIPVWQMMSRSTESLKRQAESWRERLAQSWPGAATLEGLSTVGGGSLPGEVVPTWLLALPVPPGRSADNLTAQLRHHRPPVVGRVERETLLFDPRTVLPDQEEILLGALEKLVR